MEKNQKIFIISALAFGITGGLALYFNKRKACTRIPREKVVLFLKDMKSNLLNYFITTAGIFK